MDNKNNNTGQSDHSFLVLDGGRGIAAISLVLYHYIEYLSNYTAHWMPNIYLAVELLFMLSGFVLAHTSEKRLLAGQTANQFMLRRLIRLYPLYFISMTLPYFLLMTKFLLNGSYFALFSSIGSYLLNIFALPTPAGFVPTDQSILIMHNNVYPLNGPAWTLPLLIVTNLIYAVFCRGLTTTRLSLLVFTSILIYGFALWYYNYPGMGWGWPHYLGGWSRVMFSFFAGILLYRLFHLKERPKLPSWMGFVLVIFLIADFTFWPAGRIAAFLNCVILSPLLIWCGAKTKIWEPARRLCAWLGKTSYAIYIMHMPLLPVLIYLTACLNLDPKINIPLTVGAYVVSLMAITWLLDIVYDAPIRSYLRGKLLASHRQPIPNAVTSGVEGG